MFGKRERDIIADRGQGKRSIPQFIPSSHSVKGLAGLVAADRSGREMLFIEKNSLISALKIKIQEADSLIDALEEILDPLIGLAF